MHRDEITDLLDRRAVLRETLADGVSDRDRPYLDAELAEVLAALDGQSDTGTIPE